MFKATITRRPNLDKLIKDIKRLNSPIDFNTAKLVGETVIDGMQRLIASGQSPIEGNGRFPEYKAAGEVKRLTKTKKATSLSTRKEINAQISKTKQRGYPYSVKSKYPNKQVRPVNLKLSGDFLNALEFKIIRVSEGYGVDIGYFNNTQAIKERGHRDGANGQAKRPTIPRNIERIATRIFQSAISIYKKRIQEILNSIS